MTIGLFMPGFPGSRYMSRMSDDKTGMSIAVPTLMTTFIRSDTASLFPHYVFLWFRRAGSCFKSWVLPLMIESFQYMLVFPFFSFNFFYQYLILGIYKSKTFSISKLDFWIEMFWCINSAISDTSFVKDEFWSFMNFVKFMSCSFFQVFNICITSCLNTSNSFLVGEDSYRRRLLRRVFELSKTVNRMSESDAIWLLLSSVEAGGAPWTHDIMWTIVNFSYLCLSMRVPAPR